MSGSDSISNPVARRISYTRSYPSARLNSAWLTADDVAGGSHYADVSADWSLTWHANCACWHHNYVMLTSSLSGSVLWVESSGIRVGSAIRAKKTRGSRGQPPLRRVLARAGMSHVRILRCFHQWLRLFLLYTMVWSKHNFDNFHFWAKIKHHFNHKLWYQFVGGRNH
jgi:hypothetical protein